jgi:CPA2 family monovalent cation:H+ antiporter-2
LTASCGFAAVRIGLPPLVGYLLAGVVVGPYTPGFVGDPELAQQLAEVGVILLMFGVGIHFSLDDLLAARRIALPGAIVQISAATVLGAALSQLWGWSWTPAWCSVCACRSPARSCCCARSRTATCSTRATAGSPSAG